MMVFEIIGVVALIAGIVFIFPWITVSSLSGKTTGKIIGMTRNAMDYNETANYETAEETKEKEEESTLHIHISAGVGGKNTRMGGTKPSNMYYTIFSYFVDGTEYRRASAVAYNKGYINKRIGKNVPVYYDMKNPERASLSSGKAYKWISIGLIAGGILFSVAGLVVNLISL